MFQGLLGILPIIIICGVGVVASLTYVVCLLINNRKKNKSSNKTVEVYELFDNEDSLTIPINKNR